jgi:uncharacterized membrane protein
MDCPVCGGPVTDDTCPSCGADVRDGNTAGDGDGRNQTVLGLDRNLAGAFSYSLTFVSGVVFYVLADDEFVRFHAAQSVVAFGGLFTLNLLVSFLQGATATTPGVGPALAAVLGGLSAVVTLVAFGLWILLMVTASRGRRVALPLVGGLVDGVVSVDR